MKAIDAIVLWTPDTDLYKRSPLKGKVVVSSFPIPSNMQAHVNSIGACDANWIEVDALNRLELMQNHYSSIIHNGGINPDILEDALSIIVDFQGHEFSRVKPDWIESL